MKENPFKKIETNEEAPKESREKILRELANIQLASELANHFTEKFGSVFNELFTSKKKRK